MRITWLKIQNFRNHLEKQIEWSPHLNVITGPNGAGKTNLIDAIHYLCMSRSFVANSDRYVVNEDHSFFIVKGRFKGNIRSEFEVSCSYSKGKGKKVFVNESPLERLSDLIGRVPVVVLCPEDRKLTSEGPSERRSYFDSFISQINPPYLQDLIDYRKIVRQRNNLLQQYQYDRATKEAYLEPWDQQLIGVGSKIVAKRAAVINNFQAYLDQQYDFITGLKQKTSLNYQTFCEPSEDPETVEDRYRDALEEYREKELEREITIVGPHRDEVVFYLDDMELRQYGSQGQHRLFALALKLAQLFYFTDELDDQPIFLLDDVFGDLDPHKIDVLLNALMEHAGQIFVTSATPIPFDEYVEFDGTHNRRWHIEDGELSRVD